MRLKGILYGLGIIAIIGAFIFQRLRHDRKADAQTVSQTLPAQDKAEYIIDTPHHQLITVARKVDEYGRPEIVSTKTFLAPHAKLEVRQDGSIVVTQRVWGTEFAPYMGETFDSELRIRTVLGVNGFFYRRWEVGGGLALRPEDIRDVRVFVSGGYNAYSNVLFTVGVDNHKAVSIGVAIKF